MVSFLNRPIVLEVYQCSEAGCIDRIYSVACRFHNLKIGRQVKPRCHFYVVKHLDPCSLIIKKIEAEIWNLVTDLNEVKANAKRVLDAGGDDTFAANPYTVERFNGVGLVISDAESTEQSYSLGFITIFGIEKLIEVVKERPGVV